jgi:hypothetical protein
MDWLSYTSVSDDLVLTKCNLQRQRLRSHIGGQPVLGPRVVAVWAKDHTADEPVSHDDHCQPDDQGDDDEHREDRERHENDDQSKFQAGGYPPSGDDLRRLLVLPRPPGAEPVQDVPHDVPDEEPHDARQNWETGCTEDGRVLGAEDLGAKEGDGDGMFLRFQVEVRVGRVRCRRWRAMA